MPVRFNRILTGLSIVVLLAVAGCGSDDATDTPTDESPAASIPGPGSDRVAPTAPMTDAAAEAARLHPQVRILTSLGSMTVELDGEKAPLTVENFLSYVESGHYNQTIFHQVVTGDTSVVIGGAYTDTLEEKELPSGAYPVFCEAREASSNVRGTVAMARRPDDIHSATCHFFINLTDNEVLDHPDDTPATPTEYGYCVFGRIVEGLDVADKIGAVQLQDNGEFEGLPVETVLIQSMEILR